MFHGERGEIRTEILHVLDGRAATGALTEAGYPPDSLLAWDDVLHEGPCPAGTPAETRRIRAAYLARAFNRDATPILAELEARDATLLAPRDEIVLWICRDVHDLVHSWQQIALLGNSRAGLTAVFSPEPFPHLPAEKLRALAESRRPLTPEERTLLKRAWLAFTEPDPIELAHLASEPTDFPFFNELTTRLCDEFPDEMTGLSRAQRQALEAIQSGATTPLAAFRHVAGSGDPLHMGDLSFWNLLDALARAKPPLITPVTGDWLSFNEPHGSTFLAQGLEVTEAGREVLEGHRDWLPDQLGERWIGGFRIG